MSDTLTPEPQHDISEKTILERISLPLLSFGVVLFFILFMSWIFVLPRMTMFSVGGVNVSVDEAIAYERILRADVTALDAERKEIVLPFIDATYDALMAEKRARSIVINHRVTVLSTLRRTVEAAGATVRIDADLLDFSQNTMTIRGAVKDNEPGTMAALAAGMDAVINLPFVQGGEPAPFMREQEPDGTYVSPFKISLTLQ